MFGAGDVGSNINVPSYFELEEFAKKQFPELADPKVKYLTQERIVDWFNKSEETQELLFILTNTQTYERAKKNYYIFLEVRIDYCGSVISNLLIRSKPIESR